MMGDKLKKEVIILVEELKKDFRTRKVCTANFDNHLKLLGTAVKEPIEEIGKRKEEVRI